MRRLWILAVCVFFGLAAVPAFAAIDNTHHDMRQWGGANASSCYACHGYKETVAVDNGLGTVGSLCWRCHVPTGGYAGTLPITNTWPGFGNQLGAAQNTLGTYGITTFVPRDKYVAHGRNMTNMAVLGDNTVTKAAVSGNWPHVTEAATDMECTGCHDVHSNTNAPFLRAPMSTTQTNGAATIPATFCIQCHTGSAATGTGRWVDVTAVANGSHPVETVATGAGSVKSGSAVRLGRNITIKGTVYRTATPYLPTALQTNAQHYVPGGKVGSLTAAATDNTVGCYTCHAVHIPNGAGGANHLTLANIGDPNNPSESFDALCIGCHGVAGTPGDQNPGATSYYHPVNASALDNGTAGIYTLAAGFNITVNVPGSDLKNVGANNRLVCTSCHALAHGGAANSLVLSPKTPTCGSCHNTTAKQTGSTVNSHHVYGGSTNYTQAANGGYANPSYAGANLADGLSCEDCHTFNGTAHNWN